MVAYGPYYYSEWERLLVRQQLLTPPWLYGCHGSDVFAWNRKGLFVQGSILKLTWSFRAVNKDSPVHFVICTTFLTFNKLNRMISPNYCHICLLRKTGIGFRCHFGGFMSFGWTVGRACAVDYKQLRSDSSEQNVEKKTIWNFQLLPLAVTWKSLRLVSLFIASVASSKCRIQSKLFHHGNNRLHFVTKSENL